MDSLIHQSAIVEPETIMGRGITVGPYAIIEDGAVIGDGSVIESHAVVKKWARIGEKARIGHHSVLGGDPQHLDFDKQNLTAKVLGIIDREWVALKLNELFVIEFYSRKI